MCKFCISFAPSFTMNWIVAGITFTVGSSEKDTVLLVLLWFGMPCSYNYIEYGRSSELSSFIISLFFVDHLTKRNDMKVNFSESQFFCFDHVIFSLFYQLSQIHNCGCYIPHINEWHAAANYTSRVSHACIALWCPAWSMKPLFYTEWKLWCDGLAAIFGHKSHSCRRDIAC